MSTWLMLMGRSITNKWVRIYFGQLEEVGHQAFMEDHVPWVRICFGQRRWGIKLWCSALMEDHVPAVVTVFTIHKTFKQGATDLVSGWQYMADKLNENLFIRIVVLLINEEKNGNTKRNSVFILFLFVIAAVEVLLCNSGQSLLSSFSFLFFSFFFFFFLFSFSSSPLLPALFCGLLFTSSSLDWLGSARTHLPMGSSSSLLSLASYFSLLFPFSFLLSFLSLVFLLCCCFIMLMQR